MNIDDVIAFSVMFAIGFMLGFATGSGIFNFS